MPNHATTQTPKSSTSAKTSLLLLIIGMIFAAANMRSPLVMMGSIVPMLSDDFGLSAAQIGYLGAMPMPLFAFGSLMAAVLARKFGLERMMIGMTLLLALGVAMRNWFGVMELYAGTLILSFAIGMLNALTAPFIKQYAPNNIALATGVFSLSMSTLAGFGAWMVVPFAKTFGWQFAMSSWAIFGVIAAWIWWLIYRHNRMVNPKLMPTLSSIKPTAHLEKPINLWRQKAAWQMAVLLGLQSFLFYSLASFLPSIGMAFGATLDEAIRLPFVFQVMAPLAILWLTWLSRRGTSFQIISVAGCLMNALGISGLLMMPSLMLLWSALMGFGCALVFTLSLMMFSLRTTSTETARDLSSMVQAVGYSIAMFGPLMIGKLYQWQGDWQLPLMVLVVLMIINIPFGLWAANETKIG